MTEVGHSVTSMCELGLQCGPRPATFYGPCAVTLELMRQTRLELAKHRITLAAAVEAAIDARDIMASVAASDTRCFIAARNVVIQHLLRKRPTEHTAAASPTLAV